MPVQHERESKGTSWRGQGWLTLKFTFASMLGSALLLGVHAYRQHSDKEKIKQQTIEAVFPEKNDPALKLAWGARAGETRNWLLRHNKMMQDPAKAAEFRAWLSQFDHLKDASHIEKLKTINETVGKKVTYTPEEYMYGERDYYAPPYWTMKGGVGDCDDYAVLQYYALKYVGYTDEKCFVATVATKGTVVNHAVAVVDTSDTRQKSYRAENMMLLDNNGVMYGMDNTTYLPTAFYNRSGVYLVKYPGIMRPEGAMK